MKNEFIYQMRVHIEDTDFAGIVYHSNYLNFMERARSEWLESVGMDMAWQQQEKIYFPIYEVDMKFLKPARVHEKIEIVSSIIHMTKASVTFSQYLHPVNDRHKILCTAKIKIACVNENMRPRPFPALPINFNMHLIKVKGGKA